MSFKISIITVCYNPGPKLEKTILSVLKQDYRDVEYIVVDGGSSDGTVAMLQKYGEGIARWVSEQDAGIYDALNKGIGMATGQYIAFLDSGNWYLNNHVLSDIGAMLTEDSEFLTTAYLHEKQRSWKVAIPDPLLDHLYLRFDVYFHSAFIRADVFQKFGLLNQKWKCSGDHEYVLRLYIKGVRIETKQLITIFFEDNGVSSDPRKIAYKEDRLIAIQYGVPLWEANLSFLKRYIGFSVLCILREIRLDSFVRNLLGKSRDMGLKEVQESFCDPEHPWFAERD
jgi:glycosyltransferase involved in cell wall biosynthesis